MTISVWLTSSFAPEWYADALKEARQGRDHHARRREIIFAVCCVESYLFEWVRDVVLDRQYRDVEKYFPAGDRRGIRTRWKEVVKMLLSDGLIMAVPDFGTPYWARFLTFVDFRDGLVHGKSSRPSSKSQEER